MRTNIAQIRFQLLFFQNYWETIHVRHVEKEWGKILNLAKSFPGFIEGKLMFPTTPLYIQDPNNVGVFVANVVAYGRWKTKKDDHRWVEKALHNGWGFNNLHPTHKVHVTMLEK